MSAHVNEQNRFQTDRRAEQRRPIRYFAAVMAGVAAIIYLLIGFHIVTVLEAPADQTWTIAPAIAYALGAYLLVAYDRRLLWILGAVLQVFVIFTYLNYAPQRTPAFEVWGIVIRIAQLLILVALVYLEVRLPLTHKAALADRL